MGAVTSKVQKVNDILRRLGRRPARPGRAAKTLDLRITGGKGQTVLQVWPLNARGRQWVEDRCAVEDWQWLGQSSFAVEHRMLDDLKARAEADGLKVSDERI